MPDVSISKLKDFDISQDGRKAILNFTNSTGENVAIKVSTMDLESISHEIGFILTKSRELSDISKQNIVPFVRPAKYRADLMIGGSTVVTVYQMPSGIEHRYGLEPTGAEALARQILDAAVEGKKATTPAKH